MIIAIGLLLALIPLLGVAWIVLTGSPFTVDGLFMSLILLAISGVFGTTALYELRNRMAGKGEEEPLQPLSPGASSAGALVRKGLVESVQFYESNVGQPNKSIVMLSNDSTPARMLVLEGDMRNALPVGRRVEVSFRKERDRQVLVDVTYS